MASFLRENIRISLRAIRSQLLRTTLTALIIAIGIMALVGTLNAIDVMKSSINSNFTSMGANTFTIRNREMSIRIGKRGKRPKRFRQITYDEAMRFAKEFHFPAKSSVSTFATGMATLKYESNKSNPNVQVFGADENYLSTSGYELESGRNFSTGDISNGAHVVLLGKDMVAALFTVREDPLDKIISIGSGKYKVVGVLKSKGNSFGFGGDKICIVPLSNARQYFDRPNMTFTVSVLAPSAYQLDIAVAEAEGLFRIIRDVPLGEENNFEISKSDNLANMLIDNMSKVTMGATLIGFITLFGAAIGLMNIMLVSVTERTREIGIRKSLGATKKNIRAQFLIESVVICVLGGLMGILLGALLGLLVAYGMGGAYVFPWVWTAFGISLCIVVGMISGIYPALKASRLDPIEALRFE